MNKKLLNLTLVVLLITAHPAAFALAISDIRLNSSLNQSLDATVEILVATVEELNSLNVSVSRVSGQTIGLQQWPNVQVELVRVDGGKSFLKITSKESVREPVLNILLELKWATGHIKREYSLLINPQL